MKARENELDSIHLYGVSASTREIFIHSSFDSDEDNGIDFKIANTFLKNIRYLIKLNHNPIIIHQHSIGGFCSEGLMIYDAIKSCPAKVIVVTHGVAASMGSIIPQAADYRITMPNCYWLIHEGNTGIDSSMTAKQAKSMYMLEKAVSKTMQDIHLEKMIKGPAFAGKTEKQIKYFLRTKLDKREDWWLSSEQSVQYGFADFVFGQDNEYNLMEVIKKNVR